MGILMLIQKGSGQFHTRTSIKHLYSQKMLYKCEAVLLLIFLQLTNLASIDEALAFCTLFYSGVEEVSVSDLESMVLNL